jgi:outer membrane protein assembly factor BamB
MMKLIDKILILCIVSVQMQAQGSDWPVFRGKSDLAGLTEYDISSSPVLLWNAATGAGTKSSPVLSEGLIYFGNAGSSDGVLRSVNKKTGKLIWSYPTDNQIVGSANFWSSGTKTGIIIGSYDYFLHCINPLTGKLLWKLETENYLNGTPAVADNKIIFGGCDGIVRVADPVEGRETDKIEIGVYIASSPALSSGKAYFGDYDGNLYCVDLMQKKIAWEVPATETSGSILAIPAAGYNAVVIGNDDKYMYCYNINTGNLNWKYRTNGQITGSAVISSSRVLFGSKDGYVYLLNLSDGKKLWSFNAGSPVGSSPVVTKDRFYFLTEDGRLLSFGQKK